MYEAIDKKKTIKHSKAMQLTWAYHSKFNKSNASWMYMVPQKPQASNLKIQEVVDLLVRYRQESFSE